MLLLLLLLLLVFVIVLLAFVYLKYSRAYKYWADKNVKFVKPLPMVGNIGSSFFRTKSFADMISNFYNAYPEERYIGVYQLSTPSLILRDPNLIKQITIKDFDTFPQHKTVVDDDVDPLWSKNLFSCKVDRWREMRPTLSPAFTSSKMKMMFNLIKESADQFTEYFMENAAKGTVTVDSKDVFTRYTNDLIATTAFGVKCNSLQERSNEFYLMGKDATNFSGIRSLNFFLANTAIGKIFKIKLFSKPARKFFLRLISNNISQREKDHIVRHDMIQLLLDARKGQQGDENASTIDTGFATVEESPAVLLKEKKRNLEISDEEITAHALVFFLGGFDTTSTLMCYLAHELAMNPDIQEKLRQEVDRTCEACGGSITYEGLMGMKYMDMVVAETLRKWPPFIFTDRISVRPYTIESENPEEQPLHLETGSVLWIPIFALHRDPNYYPNPDKFDPERFSDENKHKIAPCTYLPFGSGPKNCIGSRFALMENKLIICQILRKFEIVVVDKTPIPVVLCPSSFNMAPKGGFWVGFKRRTN